MSGKHSRGRRVQAVKAARDAVYRLKGGAYAPHGMR